MPIKSDVDMCNMPKVLAKLDARLYRKILAAHCENKTQGHKCLGALTITSKDMTLQCPLCGDVRGMMEPPS